MSQREIPLAGRFDCWRQGFELPDLLLALSRSGKTGHLRFENAEAEKTVALLEGKVVFAKSSSEDDRLGPFLLKAGKLRFDHLTDLRFTSPTKRFGTVLVENGILTPKDLVQGVVGQVRAIVLSLFQWTDAMYAFEERVLEKETITLRIPTETLVLDGVRTVRSWRRVTGGIGSLEAAYQSVHGIDESATALGLAPPVLELLRELHVPKSIAEACSGSSLSDFEVCQLLWGFRCLGWIGAVTEAALPVVEAELVEEEPVAMMHDEDADGLGLVLGGESST